MQASSPESRFPALEEARNDSPVGLPAPGNSERNRNDSSGNAKLSSFEEIYQESTFKAATSTAAWDILKVGDRVASEHLHGLSPAGKRLEQLEKNKLQDNERLAQKVEGMCSQYRMRIATTVQEIERERATFREWQERKEKEQLRISEAASACVPGESGSSEASISRLLERNSGRLSQLA